MFPAQQVGRRDSELARTLRDTFDGFVDRGFLTQSQAWRGYTSALDAVDVSGMTQAPTDAAGSFDHSYDYFTDCTGE